jgi:hypothetical protein
MRKANRGLTVAVLLAASAMAGGCTTQKIDPALLGRVEAAANKAEAAASKAEMSAKSAADAAARAEAVAAKADAKFHKGLRK